MLNALCLTGSVFVWHKGHTLTQKKKEKRLIPATNHDDCYFFSSLELFGILLHIVKLANNAIMANSGMMMKLWLQVIYFSQSLTSFLCFDLALLDSVNTLHDASERKQKKTKKPFILSFGYVYIVQ